MNNKFASLGTALNRDEAKKVMGGLVLGGGGGVGGEDGGGGDVGCGTGISCTGKKAGDECGTKKCICDTKSDKDKTLYCSSQP
jgi:hypothetical protein